MRDEDECSGDWGRKRDKAISKWGRMHNLTKKDNMKKKTRQLTVWLAVILAVAAVLVFALTGKKSSSALVLGTTQVQHSFMSSSVTATGTVEPVTEVDVGTQVSGIVSKLYVDYNDLVTAGQVIAEMDKVNLEAELEQAEAKLASAKTEYEYQQKQFNRTKALYRKKLVSDTEYEEASYKYETAKNSYAMQKASIVGVRRNLSYATITSPIDGIVINRAVEEGQTVAAGFETPTLYTIAADLKQMQVIGDVDEADIGQVAEGQRVEFTVDAYPDDIFTGTVKQVRLEATTTSNVVTYEVVITAYNPDLKLKPGLTANITIYTVEHENALAVPTKSLRFHPGEETLAPLGYTIKALDPAPAKSVWVVSGNTLTQTEVTSGVVSSDLTEILSGLSGDETIATGLAQASSEITTNKRQRSLLGGPGPR